MTLQLAQDKVTHLMEYCSCVLERSSHSVRELAGTLSTTHQAVLPAPFYLPASTTVGNSVPQTITVDSGAKKDLEWWTQHLSNWNGQNIQPMITGTLIETYVSKLGWRAQLRRDKDRGHWSPQAQELHINCLEIQTGSLQ